MISADSKYTYQHFHLNLAGGNVFLLFLLSYSGSGIINKNVPNMCKINENTMINI